MEDETLEIDLTQEIFGPQVHSRCKAARCAKEQGGDDGEEHGSDSEREFKPAGADGAEDGSGGEQNAQEFKSSHDGQGMDSWYRTEFGCGASWVCGLPPIPQKEAEWMGHGG